jgi:hypothetical protein
MLEDPRKIRDHGLALMARQAHANNELPEAARVPTYLPEGERLMGVAPWQPILEAVLRTTHLDLGIVARRLPKHYMRHRSGQKPDEYDALGALLYGAALQLPPEEGDNVNANALAYLYPNQMMALQTNTITSPAKGTRLSDIYYAFGSDRKEAIRLAQDMGIEVIRAGIAGWVSYFQYIQTTDMYTPAGRYNGHWIKEGDTALSYVGWVERVVLKGVEVAVKADSITILEITKGLGYPNSPIPEDEK